MGVYISNMKMPKKCDVCRFCGLGGAILEREVCQLNGRNRERGQNNRMETCPLVPVPPHGRLIDADALYRTIDATSERTIGHTTFKETVLLDIRGMPTILESTIGQLNSDPAVNEKCGFEP